MSRDASLHEKTVQKAAAIDQPRRRRAAPTRRAVTTRVVKVDRRVMATARRLAGGDMTRIEIRNSQEVIVR
jgi:hypothetical protein